MSNTCVRYVCEITEHGFKNLTELMGVSLLISINISGDVLSDRTVMRVNTNCKNY